MKKTTLFSLSIFLVIASAAQVATIPVTTIRLADSANIEVSFFYADHFNDTNPPFPVSSGNPVTQISMEKPVLLFNSYSGIPYYIKPGEELFLTAFERKPRLVSSSKERNNELDFFAELNKQYPDFFSTNASMRMKQNIRSAVYAGVVKFENEKEKKGNDFLEMYRSKNTVSDEFYKYARDFFHYLKLANLFSLLSSETIQIKDRPSFNDAKKNMEAENFSCDNCIDNLIYRMSAYSYLQYIVRSDVNGSGNKSRRDVFAMIDSMFTGKTREFLLFIKLKEQLKYGTAQDTSFLAKYIGNQNESNFLYAEYIRKEIEFKKAAGNKNELLNNSNERTNLGELISKSKGKLILIDFWASWCIPCRKSMPLTKKLAKDNDQLKVIFISTDERYSDWKKASLSEHIDTSDHSFVIVDYQKSEIKKRFKIQAIPRYILIGKTGEVIAGDAPHPGSAELKALIERNL